MTMEQALKSLGIFSKSFRQTLPGRKSFENLFKSLCWFWLLGKCWFQWSIRGKKTFIFDCKLKDWAKMIHPIMVLNFRIWNNYRWALWSGIIYLLGGKDEGQRIVDSIYTYETRNGWTEMNSNLISARMRHSSLANGKIFSSLVPRSMIDLFGLNPQKSF